MRTLLELAADCLDLTVEALSAVGIALRRLRGREEPVADEARAPAVPMSAAELTR